MNNIMMNIEMTKAILDGRKTQTRRVVKNHIYDVKCNKITYSDLKNMTSETHNISFFIDKFARFKKNEVIWVREPAKVIHYFLDSKNNAKRTMKYKFLADGKDFNIEIPGRFIVVTVSCGNFIVAYPRWIHERQRIPNGCIKEMARIFLKITDIRVERLKDMEFTEIKKEGVVHSGLIDGMQKWEYLWSKTAQKGYKWEDNPYVFVYEFERVNEDGSEL